MWRLQNSESEYYKKQALLQYSFKKRLLGQDEVQFLLVSLPLLFLSSFKGSETFILYLKDDLLR